MKDDDLLSQMTSALAEEYDGATSAPGATRARVVRTLAERKPRRRKWLSIGVPAFVLFGGSTAWAAVTGNLPPVMQKVVSVLIGDVDVEEPVVETPVPNKTGKWTPPAPVEAVEAPASEEVEQEPEEKTEEPAVEEAPAPPPQVASVSKNPKPSSEASKKAEPPPEDHTALLTYRAAHRAHFQQGDCTGAVAGYRKYLREQPGGTFALEAKYNLGVCLIRMGENAEAKRLLQPFADGVYGDYRREKSQELIDALGN